MSLLKSIKNKFFPSERLSAFEESQLQLRSELGRRQSADFYYLIDIVGTCNLRCPSCPVGYYESSPIKVGLMEPERYRLILDKIKREHPGEKIFVDLYNWGEPGLHKNLSDFVKMTKEYGMGVGISSNLNVFPDLKNVIRSEPDYIRVSLSGFRNEIYQKTHKAGDINLVKSNLYLLRYWINKLNSSTIVQVGFHVYKSNFPDDFDAMRKLCHELNFIFAPVIASLMPAEKAMLQIEDVLVGNDQELIPNLVVTPKDRYKLYAPLREKHKDCQYRRIRTTISYDGSVPLCCATFEGQQIIAKDFLSVDRQQLQSRKYQHDFCKKCQSKCLDMTYTDAEPQLINKEAIKVLGTEYADFLRVWETPLKLEVLWREGKYSDQEAFDLAFKYESTDLVSAENLYKEITKVFSRHGESYFRLGVISESRGNIIEALSYQKVCHIAPDHALYVEAMDRINA